jgi:hypothetical protein
MDAGFLQQGKIDLCCHQLVRLLSNPMKDVGTARKQKMIQLLQEAASEPTRELFWHS